VNIYAGEKKDVEGPEAGKGADPFSNVNVYRGTEKSVVEVLKND
jgi:hypothetical protein